MANWQIVSDTSISRMAGPPSSGKSLLFRRAMSSGLPVRQSTFASAVENPAMSAGSGWPPGSLKFGSGPCSRIASARRRVVPCRSRTTGSIVAHPAPRLRLAVLRHLRCENLAKAFVASQFALAARRLLQEPLDDGVRGDAFAGGGEVGQDAVAQHREGQGLDVLALDVAAAVEQGASLAAQDQVLDGTRAGAPRQPVAHELRRARLAHARLPHQRQRV